MGGVNSQVPVVRTPASPELLCTPLSTLLCGL